MPRRYSLVLASILVFASCRREVRLDEVLAYATKPSVVRVSAVATAEFHYEAESILAVERKLANAGIDLAVTTPPDHVDMVETGAGGSGSGFIISDEGTILTSGHVVAPTRDAKRMESELRRNGAIAALVKHFPVDGLRAAYRSQELQAAIAALAAEGVVGRTKSATRVELSNGEVLPYTIRRYSPALAEGGTDLAILQVARRNLPALPLGDSDATRVGESIWAIGYPAVASSTDDVIGGWLSRETDLEATFNPGTITAIKRDVMNTPVFQSNVAIYRGNSGGPVVNRAGEVIGISAWGHKDVDQIKFLVPMNVARRMIAEAGLHPSTAGAFNTSYRRALDAASEGRWIEARQALDTAGTLFRNSPDLVRFRRDIVRGLEAAPLWQRQPLMVAGAGGALVAVVMATVWFLLVRRRGTVDTTLPPLTQETMVEPEGASPGRQRVLGRFTILNGSRAGERLGLGGSGIRIGRESAVCEIVLENPKVSRLHAEVVSLEGKVVLVDRSSSNGTYVNDQKIDRRVLRDGDIIYFGGRNAVAVAYHV